MTLTYGQRIQAAEQALREAETARDFHHPGSAEWQVKQGLVEAWKRQLDDLRREAQGI